MTEADTDMEIPIWDMIEFALFPSFYVVRRVDWKPVKEATLNTIQSDTFGNLVIHGLDNVGLKPVGEAARLFMQQYDTNMREILRKAYEIVVDYSRAFVGWVIDRVTVFVDWIAEIGSVVADTASSVGMKIWQILGSIVESVVYFLSNAIRFITMFGLWATSLLVLVAVSTICRAFKEGFFNSKEEDLFNIVVMKEILNDGLARWKHIYGFVILFYIMLYTVGGFVFSAIPIY